MYCHKTFIWNMMCTPFPAIYLNCAVGQADQWRTASIRPCVSLRPTDNCPVASHPIAGIGIPLPNMSTVSMPRALSPRGSLPTSGLTRASQSVDLARVQSAQFYLDPVKTQPSQSHHVMHSPFKAALLSGGGPESGQISARGLSARASPARMLNKGQMSINKPSGLSPVSTTGSGLCGSGALPCNHSKVLFLTSTQKHH